MEFHGASFWSGKTANVWVSGAFDAPNAYILFDGLQLGGSQNENMYLDQQNETVICAANCYLKGNAAGGNFAGGLVGENNGYITMSYSTGVPSGREFIGGLIGYDSAPAGKLTDTYWDTDTSGIANLDQGAGNIANDPGITGLTTAQFQAGLPQGFDPKVWTENPNINGGLPYVIANPPR